MSQPTRSIVVNVDVMNPGQFFACCGLLELADRLWPGAEGWFEPQAFCIRAKGTLDDLITALARAELSATDPDDVTCSPVVLGSPFIRPIHLDWWHDEAHYQRKFNGKELKVWAGTMESLRIARSMQLSLRTAPEFRSADLLNVGLITYDPDEPTKKVEPYYFDARRCPNAHSRDVGFSPNDLGMTTTAYPAVELLCLVGLQVARGTPTEAARVYDYFTWSKPILSNVLLPASLGQLDPGSQQGYRFENWYRTGQKKHKAFCSAISLSK